MSYYSTVEIKLSRGYSQF